MKLKKLTAIALTLVFMMLTLVSCGIGKNATSGNLDTNIDSEDVENSDESDVQDTQTNLTNKVAVVKTVNGGGNFTVEYYSGDADNIDDYSVIDMSGYTASGTEEELTLDENIAVCFCTDGEWYATTYEKIAANDVLIISYDEQGAITSVIIPTKE